MPRRREQAATREWREMREMADADPELPGPLAQGQGERDDGTATEVQTERARFIVYPLLLTPETGRVTGGCNLYPQRPPSRDVTLTLPSLSLTTALSLALTSATLVLAALAARPGTHSS